MRPSRVSLLLGTLAAGALSAQEPPALLQITVETIKPGSEAQYGAIEERLAEMCARRGCPNDYLALESTTSPTQVWWFTMYATQADIARIALAYQRDADLLHELRELSTLKSALTDVPVNHIAARQPELGDSSPWRIGELQFAAVAVTPARHVPGPRIGTVFDEPEGSSRFTVIGAATRAEAEAAAASLGADALIFEVRPSWSKPANAWVAANPELWARR